MSYAGGVVLTDLWPVSTRMNKPENDDPWYSIPSSRLMTPPRRIAEMMDQAEKRSQLIRHLEDALALSDEI